MLAQWLPLLILPFMPLPILAQSHLPVGNFSLSKSTLGPFFGVLDGNFQPTRTVEQENEKTDLVYDELAVDLLEDNDGSGKGADNYTFYDGNGTTAAGWPPKKNWVSYGDMWTINAPILNSSCMVYNQNVNTAAELSDLRTVIDNIAEETKLDHRFILAIAIQESGACMRVPTSDLGVRNPGIMQSHNGDGTCNEDGEVKEPCPKSEIEQMVRDGVQGTEDGDGLVDCVNDSDAQDVSAFYIGARRYNSGSVAESGNLSEGTATHCYASDVAAGSKRAIYVGLMDNS